jgi:hypothetical protein
MKYAMVVFLILGSGCAHLRPPAEREASHDYAVPPRAELGEPGTTDNPDKRFGLFGALY